MVYVICMELLKMKQIYIYIYFDVCVYCSKQSLSKNKLFDIEILGIQKLDQVMKVGYIKTYADGKGLQRPCVSIMRTRWWFQPF